MPIIKSAKKRVKVAQKANLRNVKTKRSMREALKAFAKVLASGTPAEISEAERKAVSAIDQAAKKAVIHKNKAARQKAALSAKAKAAGAKKTTAKKPAAKKAAAKKPAAKKAAK
ncbi:MAG TPA: 30S ribosomal protein S20 [Candidatus Saccharimonadales bacterium]|nr:30S ribosomal protein S20 [Candidatus Saccharimonadales bacterium]